MNTPASREGNLIRYAVYFIGYLITLGVTELVIKKPLLHLWDLILFILIATMVLVFYAYRFNREQRYFARQLYIPWLGDFGLVVGLTLGVTAMRIIIMYLQTYRHLSWYYFQQSFLHYPSKQLFWFLLLAQGIILPILQEFLATGFLFNYAFRRNNSTVALWGIFTSGLIFTLLNWQASVPLLLINFLYGMLFAWSYLYTQTLIMPLYLAVINGLLLVIMT